MRPSVLTIGAASALLALVGCGGQKTTVFGLVTLDGRPLDNGSMQFFPVAGDAPASAAFIGKDGRYRAEVAPTKFKAVIHVNKLIGHRKLYEDQLDSPLVEINDELLPPRYSDINKTELIF